MIVSMTTPTEDSPRSGLNRKILYKFLEDAIIHAFMSAKAHVLAEHALRVCIRFPCDRVGATEILLIVISQHRRLRASERA